MTPLASVEHAISTVTVAAGLSRQIAFNVAACAAVGLEYWADHPGASNKGRYVWALDDAQQPHIVHIRGGATTEGTAEHQCSRASRRTDGKHNVWVDKPYINEHGVRIQSGYRMTGGIKDTFRGTHIPQCDGGIDAAPVRFEIARSHTR